MKVILLRLGIEGPGRASKVGPPIVGRLALAIDDARWTPDVSVPQRMIFIRPGSLEPFVFADVWMSVRGERDGRRTDEEVWLTTISSMSFIPRASHPFNTFSLSK